jgi:LasA protease
MAAKQKTRSKGKLGFSLVFLVSILFSSCAPAYTSPIDLTATSITRKSINTPTALLPTKSAKSGSSDGGLASIHPIITSSNPLPTLEKTIAEKPQTIFTPFAEEQTPTLLPSKTPFPTVFIPEITSTSSPMPTNSPTTPSSSSTPEPENSSLKTTPAGNENKQKMVLYYSQAGDTRPAVAVRYGVPISDITSPQDLPNGGLLNPNQLLVIPNILSDTGPGGILMPDSEVVYSPSALDFDIEKYVNEKGGYLSTYKEYLSSGWHTGAEVIKRVAIENSINPRLLLSLLEFRSHWVLGQPAGPLQIEYPISLGPMMYQGLYHQLSWAVQQFSIGYYGWRAGLITTLTFPDKTTLRIAPELNAGTVAVQYLFSKIEKKDKWGAALYSPGNLSELHTKMFGNPWLRAQTVEPLYPTDLKQPVLTLPYKPGASWSFSGGPHSAWGPDGALAALDFAPPSNFHGCAESFEWITAAAPGLVVRSANGVVIVDLDGDGFEQTGWAILYLHVETKDRIPKGTWLNQDDKIGHPSCEGGVATGTHVHIARKYNGEWILADGPMPFVLSGWTTHAGNQPYLGKLTKDDMVAQASTSGTMETLTKRPLKE